MKKIFIVLATCGSAVAILSSCNNAAEVQKQVEEQNAKVQSLVDEKVTALEAEVAAECDAAVLAVAQVQYDSLLAASKPVAGKPAPKKPAAKPVAKKEEPTLGTGKQGTQQSAPTKLGEGKQGTQQSAPTKLGEGKQGLQNKQ